MNIKLNENYHLCDHQRWQFFTLFSFCRLTDSIFRVMSLLEAAKGVICSIILLICFRDVVTDLQENNSHK